MEKIELRELLEKVKAGEISLEAAELRLKMQPFEDLGYAKVDHHRGIRQGNSEVIFGMQKTPEQISGIVDSMRANGEKVVLITKMSAEAAEFVSKRHKLSYNKTAMLGYVGEMLPPVGSVLVVSAGTSDMPVAEEAALTAEVLGNKVTRVFDAGVAGLHRLLSHTDEIMKARVIVAVAGMEGALASVVGGLADCPVIAVPTSVGYGASFGGVAALLSMLNSCASGVSVVNIDNGFGAGYLAGMINHMGDCDYDIVP